MTADERLAVCEQRIKDAEKDIAALFVMMQGPPRDESVRGRLHMLEQNNAAANAATAAVEAVKLVQSSAANQRFSRGEKLVGLAFTCAFLILQTITLVYLTQGHSN